MAFVLAATTTQTGVTALSGFALFAGNRGSNRASLVPFVSGIAHDYYITGNQYTAGNELYFQNTSTKLNDVLTIGTGLFCFGNFRDNNGNNLVGNYSGGPRWLNVALFPNLSAFSGEGNIYTGELDFTSNLFLRNAAIWAGGPLSSLKITNLKNIQTIDLRDSKLSAVNINGCIINSMNICDCQLSAFEFNGGQVFDIAASNNPYRDTEFNFNKCDTLFVSSIRTLQLSKWNEFSPENFSTMRYNITSVNLRGLSSIEILDLAQTTLTSVEIPQFNTLKKLYLGGLGLNRNGNTGTRKPRLLSATSIVFNPLTALEYLNIMGMGPMKSNNQITGLNTLSSLRLMDIQENTTSPNGLVEFSDIDISMIPGNKMGLTLSDSSRSGGILASYCSSLTGVNFGDRQGFNHINSFLDFTSCTSLSSLNLSALSGLNFLTFASSKISQERYTPPFNNSNLYWMDINSTNFSYFDSPGLSANLVYFFAQNVPQLTGVDLSRFTRNIFTIIQNSPVTSLGLSSLSTTQTLTIDNINILDLDFEKCKSLQSLNLLNNSQLSSVTDFNYLTALVNFNINNNDKLGELDLVGLSSLNSFQLQNNAILSALKTDYYFPSLTSVIIPVGNNNLNNNPQLSSFKFNGQLIKQIDIGTGGAFSPNFTYINFDNNPNLETIDLNAGRKPQINQFFVQNAPRLNSLVYSRNGVVQSLRTQIIDFNDAYNLNNINLSYTSLTSLDFLINTPLLRDLSIFNDDGLSASNISGLSYATQLSSIIISTAPYISSFDAVNFNTLNRLKYFACLSNPVQNINNLLQFNGSKSILESLLVNDNLLGLNSRLNGLLLSSYPNVKTINFDNSYLNYKDLDSILLGLCANPFFGLYNDNFGFTAFSTNVNQRSKYSTAAWAALTARFSNFNKTFEFYTNNDFDPSFITTRAAPDIIINAYPATLQYTATGSFDYTCKYFDTTVTSVVSVLSGPGAMIATNVLSALSSAGTIAAVVSSVADVENPSIYYGYTTGLFQSSSAIAFITLQKLDLSNNIVFTGLQRIVDGFTIAASASVTGYPGLSTVISYYLDGVVTTPLQGGFYTVSATIINNDYAGSSTAVLSVIDPATTYTVPDSANSSYIYSPAIFDTSKDVVVSFDYAFYGTQLSGTEGFCVAFVDATSGNFAIAGGGPGKALTYTNLQTLSTNGFTFNFVNYDGRTNALLGIGFDASGMFGVSSFGVLGYNAALPNSITIREGSAYNFNTIYRSNALPVSLYQSTTAEPEFYTAKIKLYNLGKNVSVSIKPSDSENFINIADIVLPHKINVNSVNPSIGYGTGSIKSNFKIKNFNVNGFVV
jgi:hypothetical protein